MRGFHQAKELTRGYQRYVFGTTPANDDNFLVIGHAIEKGRQFRAELGVGGLNRHVLIIESL
jgi:hypothetical protein